MPKIIVAEFLTLDGVMEASEEWQPAFVTEDVAEEIQEAIHSADGTLYGRKTYELLAAYWPFQTDNAFGIADKLNSERKYVVSSTLEEPGWKNTTLIEGNLAEEVRKLKQQPGGDIRVVGSASVAQSLMEEDLVDEYWLLVHPIVRGHGKRLFEDGLPRMDLELVEAKGFRSGVVLLRYQIAKQRGGVQEESV